MDIFDILGDIAKRKTDFMHAGMSKYTALNKCRNLYIWKVSYTTYDIRKICGI